MSTIWPVTDLVDHEVTLLFCTNRTYMSQAYLSPRRLCPGCSHELEDLFAGSSGVFFRGWFCTYKKEVDDK